MIVVLQVVPAFIVTYKWSILFLDPQKSVNCFSQPLLVISVVCVPEVLCKPFIWDLCSTSNAVKRIQLFTPLAESCFTCRTIHRRITKANFMNQLSNETIVFVR